MFYKLFILLRTQKLLKRLIRKTKTIFGTNKSLKETSANLIRKYSPNKSFVDIGALWGVDGMNSFIAEESGATRVVATDIYPASQKFLENKKNKNSKVNFVQGDINMKKTLEQIGLSDVVFCTGVLYHTPDPIHLLSQLHSICKETLILGSASIPEMPGIKNGTVFYPFLSEKQRRIWNLGVGSQKAITGPYEPEEGYANWFWGFTPSALESMLQCAGFEVIERHIWPFVSIFVCKTVNRKFLATSGEWTTPNDADFLKLKR